MAKKYSFLSGLLKKADRILEGSIFRQVQVLLLFYAIILVAGWLVAMVMGMGNRLRVGTDLCDPLWWAFVHTMDPGFLGGETAEAQIKLRPLSIFLTFSGFIILGGVLISVLVNAYERRMRQVREGIARYSFRKDHGIILGWDRMGPATVRQLISEGCREVVVLSLQRAEDIHGRLKAVSASWDKESRKRFGKIFIFHGSFDSLDELQGLRPQNAKKVVILGDSDVRGSNSRNLQAAMRIAEILGKASKKSKQSLDCQVAISHLRTYDLLQEFDLSEEDRNRLNFRPFNFYEGWARKVWSQLPGPGKPRDAYAPLFYHPEQCDENASVAVAVIGFGQMGQAMAIQAARLANHANNRDAEIFAIDSDLSSITNKFVCQYGIVDDRLPGVKFSFHGGGAEAPEIRSLLTDLAKDPEKILTVAICLSDPDQSMATALGLPPEVLIGDIPILVRQETTSGLSEFARRLREQTTIKVTTMKDGQKVDANDTRWDNIRFFGSLDEFLLDDGHQEALAQTIHKAYLNYLNRKGWADSGKPAQKEWGRLSEKYRWSNRYQADAYRELLNAHGFELVSAEGASSEKIAEFEGGVLESMARQEHNRWWVERALAGWTKGPGGDRDDLRLRHPNMVPFDELDAETKAFDREVIRRMPGVLKAACNLFIRKK